MVGTPNSLVLGFEPSPETNLTTEFNDLSQSVETNGGIGDD